MEPKFPKFPGIVLTLICVAAFGQNDGRTPKRIIVTPGSILDVKSGQLLSGKAIVIEDGRIAKISSVPVAPEAGDQLIDLRDYTVLPGLFDMHTHLAVEADRLYDAGSFTENDIRWELRAVKNARATLMAGFTSVRELGGTYFGDTSLRDAINDGDIIGPRIAACGMQMSITGGHADAGAFLSSDLNITGRGVADGVEGVQKKVREIIKYGADVIKVMASGGVTSPKDDPTAAAYSLDELKAIVDDAHRLGHRVAAHAHSSQGIMFAVEAGVDSVEHGSYIDDAAIALMKKKGTFLVPTLYLHRYALENLDHLPWPEAVKQHERTMIPVIRNNIRHAIEGGVKIAFGTDAAMFPHGLNAREFAELVGVGLTPLQAIQSATINAAELMGWSKDAGTIGPGKFADLIAVKGNPLQDVRTLEKVRFVMKGGTVYKSPNPLTMDGSENAR